MQITGTKNMYLTDRMWLEGEEDYHNALIRDVNLAEKVYIGVAIHGDDYEVYVDKFDDKTTEWFLTFKDALDYCKAQYPEGDWFNI